MLETLRQWVLKAEHDLKNTALALRGGRECPTDTVCFHAQQCVEKYMKAFLVLKLIDFPKTHDLDDLAWRSPDTLLPLLSNEERGCLTEYAVVVRYPGEGGEISLAEARRAVRLARQVRSAIRKLLPRAALAGRKRERNTPR
ncbi:MAG: HEPN domain-containing protein [Planctomycetota bacterium]